MEPRPEMKSLQERVVCVPGGRDKDGRPLILVTIPTDSLPLEITTCLQYLLTIYSDDTRRQGLTIILDARKGPWKIARSCIRQITSCLSVDELAHFIVLRPENFLDKQRVENCTNTPKDGQVLFIPRSRLNKLVDQSQLPLDLGGSFIYNHDLWMENRLKVEEYLVDSATTLKHLDDLHLHFMRSRLLRPSEVETVLNNSADLMDTTKIMTHDTLEKGRLLLEKIECDNRNRKFASESDSMLTPQDILDTLESLENVLSEIRRKQTDLEAEWRAMEKNFLNTKDLSLLEEGIVKVTNWILGPAENLLNSKQKVGYDVASAEELRREHEAIELQCWDTYGAYAELIHKIENFARGEILTLQQKDLISQKDFMDFVCRSFATRLERRRNILITSLRFFRLVSEYFDKTGEVFDSLVMGNKIGNFAMAGQKLKELQESQAILDAVERELVKEGEKLSDMLSMPVKDALGREVTVDYSEDIVNVRDILDATTARKNIFSDSVELQKRTLEQVTHIYQYEKDVTQAIQWLDDLFHVMLKDHGHVGCTVYEIQAQKDDHQTFQETAKDTYNYGCQLLNASLALRQSCKLPTDIHTSLHQKLKFSWQRLLNVSQEQMTRLRVSAVFHRSVEDHCNQLRDLREAVATIPLMDMAKKRARVRHYFSVREKLLVEVGRMVRLGRLLRSRLKEPLYFTDLMSDTGSKDESRESETADPEEGGNNATAIEAISERLTEVTNLAEELDQTLRNAQQDCAIMTTPTTSATVTTTIPITVITSTKSTPEKSPNVSEDLQFLTKPSSKPEELKSDEEFQTASDCTLQHSRSSSYNTASECEHVYAPWWEYGKDDVHEDIAKEKMVLAVGIPELPPAKSVLKPSPEVPPGKIVREVTETTHLKVQHSHSLGVSSFVLTSETVRDKKNETMARKEEVKISDERGQEVAGKIEREGDADELGRRIKECGDWIQLKILEVTPELTTLGNTLSEALELQQAHDEVLRQLQNKQSPVEELLRQADQLISTQKPRAEVYAAMAESLGRAWKDVNFHLELRKQILDLNVQYHTRAQEFFDRMDALEASCTDTLVPIEIEAVKGFLTNIHELRRAVLEALMSALHTGNALIAKLKELGAEGTLDSRPDRIRSSVERAISQVQGWMDELHVRRQVLEATFTRRKDQLEQCLALAVLAADMRELEDTIQERRELLASTDQLGDSASSAELLQFEHKKLLPEARQLQEKALKITKATERLVASGCFAGEEATAQAYSVLSTTSDYLTDLQQRDGLLDRVIAFFRSAQAALTKLDQIEIQLTTTDLPKTSPQLAQLHAQCARTLEEIVADPVEEGHSILNITGRGRSGTEGIKRMVEELENRKLYLSNLCVAHKEENRRINQALNTFLEKQIEIYSWLVDIAEAFLQGHRDMGSDLSMARDFLNLHNQLLNDLQTKGNEINALLLTLPPILEYLEDNQRREVDEKVEALHERWIKLKNLLEKRLDLAAIYVKFHAEADIVSKEIDNLEQCLKTDTGALGDETAHNLEIAWESLIPLYQSAKNTGLTFTNEARQVSEPYLDTSRACVCVESVLERLKGRQLVVTRAWETFRTELVEKRETLVKWEENMVESTKTINWVSKLDTQLYPVITTSATSPKDLAIHVEQKLETVLPEIKRAQCEVEQRIKTTEALMAKAPPMDEKSLNVKNKLMEMNQKLVEITTEYQILLERLATYFNNVSELDKSVSNMNTQYSKIGLPNNITDLEVAIREHETSRQTVIEMFKFAQNDCEQIISRINRQEPKNAAEQDVAKLQHTVRIRRDNWERDWSNRRDTLEAHRQLCQFDTDLQQINNTLSDLGRQLSNAKGQYGESLPSANAISLNFVYFEKTIEVLEQRIESFVRKGEQMLEQQHIHSPHIEHHIKDLQDRWNKFKQQVAETRRLIDLSIKYFQLVDEADEWFREGSRLLMTITRKATTVKRPEEAQILLNEIETFLKPGESKQDERIKAISKLAKEIFGVDKSEQVNDVLIQNTDMLESFSAISEELNTLARNLKQEEEQRETARREQEEAHAKLEAAKAEAMAAQAAARAAEEARKAAETAAKLLREASLSHKVEVVQVTHTKEIPQVKEKTQELKAEITEVVEEIPQLEAPIFTSPLSDAVIQEGSKFTFICQVTGVPVPVVTWHKDGISIQNNPDYQTTFDQGLCTLTIEETFAEDSARYTCKAINAAGSAETSAVLSVKETEPEEQLIPPSFSKLLQPAQAKEGQAFQFECKVEGNPLPTVQWFKNSDCIDNSPDYIITYNNGEAILKFEQVFLEDKAEYSCKAMNDLGTAQCSASLNVIPLEPTEAPAFLVPLSNVMARAGQKIKLECEVSGLPPPTLSWSHNGKTVKETRENKLLRDDKKATLIIYEAFPKDAGTYAVTASNIAGEASSTCGVSVKGRLPTETSDSELASDMEPVKPSIQLALKDITVSEGNKVRLDCVIVGQPEPEVIWYHDDRPVKESPDFQLLFQGDRCTLIIHEALPEDAGEYKVVALNSAGEASSKCVLSVNPAAELEKDTKPEEEKPTGSPPKFSKLLSDILVSEGDKVILEATVTGEPKPEIKWLLNNQLISPSEHITIAQDEESNLKLEIDKVVPEDKGVYTVKAINPSGEAKCFAQLIVKSSKVAEVKIHEEIKSAPVFKEVFRDRTVFDKTATKFECIIVGKPTPKVRWLFNDEPVSGKNFLVSTSGERQVLTIPEVTKENAGKITCVAENEAGKAILSCNLSVKEVIDVTLTDGSIQIMPISKDIQQHTESSYTLKREVFVQSSTSQSSKVITSSSLTAEPNVEEHKYIAQNEQTFKQIDQKPPEIKESRKVEEFHQVDKQPIIHEKSTSITSIGGKTDSQESIKTEHVVIQKPAIKARPPKFITPVIGKIVDQGADVVLEGILDGFPTPEITWTKNGAPFTEGEGVKITYELNGVRVEIKNVNSNDAGRYTCTAVNDAGKAISTSDLVVRKAIFPPVFGRRLQAQVIKKWERVNMEVEVTGTPEPTITWFKDGEPIEENLKDGFRIRSQGNRHTLVIDKAEITHTGKYMVRAVNSGGEAQSIADVAVFEPTPDTMVEVVKTVVFEDVRKHETLTSASDKSTTTISTKEQVSVESPKPVPKPTGIPKPVEIIKPVELPKPVPIGKPVEIPVTIERAKPVEIPKSIYKPFVEAKPVELPKQATIYRAPEQVEVKKEISIIKSETPLVSESSVKSSESKISSQTLSSKTEFSSVTEKSVKQESKILKLERTTPVSFGEPISITKREHIEEVRQTDLPVTIQKETTYEIIGEAKPETKLDEATEDTGIQTTSITKQQSLDYFVKKMKETEEPIKPKELPKVAPIKQELYTKFEETSKAESEELFKPKEVPKITPIKQELYTKFEDTSKAETHKQEYVPFSSPLPEPIVTRTETYSKDIKESFLPSTQESYSSESYQKFSTFSSSREQKFEEFNLVPEPPPEICYEPKRETKTEEVSETAKKLKESYKEIATTEIPVGAVKIFPTPPTKVEIPKPQVIEQKSVKSEFYKAETSGPIYRPQSEAIEMERLWTSQKTTEIERPVSVASSTYSTEKQTFTRPLSAASTASLEPVVDALTMEKSWAHKHSESQLQTSWPPSQPEIPKPASTWSVQSTLEKDWKPSAETITKETKTTTRDSFQASYQKKWEVPKIETVKREIKPVVTDAYVPHYIAEVTHVHNVNEFELSQAASRTETITEFRKESQIIEEQGSKASEIIKSWPPKPRGYEEIPYKPITPTMDSLTIRPVSVQDITDEVYLEPGPPPEIGFAQPPRERKQSYVEIIEQDLERNLEKEPTRVLPGAIRTIPPPPLPPKKELRLAPPLPARPIKVVEPPKKIIEIVSKPFERFPDLEPFPFKPEPERPKPPKVGPPPTPSKFIKGKFTDSDYESDFESIRIPPKWRPYVSDTEEPMYRRVQPPKLKAITRSRSIEKEALPPSKFERPPEFQGPPRPVIDFETSRQLKKETQQVKKQVKHYTKHVQHETRKEVKKEVSPPELKPGSPPVYVQVEPKPKPPSPKTKQKVIVDGYMADTDEPFTLRHKKSTKSEYKHEEKSEYKEVYQSSQSTTETTEQKFTTPAPKLVPPKFSQHKRHVQSTVSSKKELVTTPIITSVSTTEKIIEQDTKEQVLEPFPFKTEPTRPKRAKAPPPPPSPSKFVKGEFKESDYESDYEGRIPPVWRPTSTDSEPAYKPVRPVLTPSGRHSQTRERTPTPPSQFDTPPQIIGLARPKFEPIEKQKKTVKLDEIIKPIPKPAIYKPTPVIPKQQITDVIIATPAVPEKMVLQPGTPPEIGYAPGPQKTQYYRSTTSVPYQNAVQTETSNVMHFNESTEQGHRTVSVQQTTRVIKFGDQTKKTEEVLEPFPFKPETDRPRRTIGPPPTKPKKFIPGEFRESDYESEVESTRIKSKWAPSGSDTEDLHYRRVKAPSFVRSSSVPTPQERIYTPMEFDTQPPQISTKITTESTGYVSGISKKFGETKSSQIVKQSKFPPDVQVQPGTPPEYGYVPEKITKSTATKIASHHMDSMTQSFKSKAQQFASDIMSDVNQKSASTAKPILKPTTDGDAQVYREETRAAQYGTKHVDPDTGLIYFKYDFGYEFGIILPGESKNGQIPVPKKTIIQPPKRSSDIEMPVYHETSSPKPTTNHAPTPQFRPKKFVPSGKNVKWEPTSESEMSEYEGDIKKKLTPGTRWEQSSCSPVSISPSLPSTSPAFNSYSSSAPGHVRGTETPPSCPSTPGSIPGQQQSALNKRAPLFITPLRDIAVVSGQTARFECIVQSEPPPSILWSKNGRIIQNSNDYQIFFRNGVCRLMIPQAFPEDAGTYTCTATNQVGAAGTTATLQVPGERRSAYIK